MNHQAASPVPTGGNKVFNSFVFMVVAFPLATILLHAIIAPFVSPQFSKKQSTVLVSKQAEKIKKKKKILSKEKERKAIKSV